MPSVSTATFGLDLSDSRRKGNKIHPSCDALVLLKGEHEDMSYTLILLDVGGGTTVGP